MFVRIYLIFRKKFCENIADTLKGTEPPAMYDLGLEFLRIYDGKFNYRQGHTVCHSVFVS